MTEAHTWTVSAQPDLGADTWPHVLNLSSPRPRDFPRQVCDGIMQADTRVTHDVLVTMMGG